MNRRTTLARRRREDQHKPARTGSGSRGARHFAGEAWDHQGVME